MRPLHGGADRAEVRLRYMELRRERGGILGEQLLAGKEPRCGSAVHVGAQRPSAEKRLVPRRELGHVRELRGKHGPWLPDAEPPHLVTRVYFFLLLRVEVV